MEHKLRQNMPPVTEATGAPVGPVVQGEGEGR